MMSRTNLLLTACAALALAACATFDVARNPAPAAVPRAESACVRWLAAIDDAVARAGVGDASAYRIPGFPYLRDDRFTASFAAQAYRDDVLFAALAQAARSLDREARAVEIGNLPMPALAALASGERDAVAARTEACAGEIMAADLAQPAQRGRVLDNARVPDDYIDWNRIVGLYPLAHPFFAAGVARWHEEAIEAFRSYAAGGAPQAAAVRYMPASGTPLSAARIREMLARAPRDGLGRIHPAPADLDRLFDAFAPVIEVENGGQADAIGALGWGPEAPPVVDASRPIVYRRMAYTRYGGEVLPQLVYTAWFSERPRTSAVDVLAGKLDGIVFRVTLGGDGNALVYDSIHPCGCYHMFFPSARLRELPSPRPGDEWTFAPAPAPEPRDGQRIVLHLQSGTHYLTGVGADRAAGGTAYAMEDDDSLRSLPLPGGGRRSIYAADGLVAGSERLERLLFWPMGVPSAGTMRQWGHNATAFLGRRHFDDADLIERRYALAP
jgi:hypothetical protein